MQSNYDIDLTTEGGIEKAKENISSALKSFTDNDKDFLGKLLFTMLKTIAEHEVEIENIKTDTMDIIKKSAKNLSDLGYLHKHTFTH